MTREEAVGNIISDYLHTSGSSLSEFARKCNTSKSFISKIVNKRFGKLGISSTYISILAKGMNLEYFEFQQLIEKYQNNPEKQEKELKNEIIIKNIISNLNNYNEKDLKVVNDIIKNCNSERLEIINNLLKSMK